MKSEDQIIEKYRELLDIFFQATDFEGKKIKTQSSFSHKTSLAVLRAQLSLLRWILEKSHAATSVNMTQIPYKKNGE